MFPFRIIAICLLLILPSHSRDAVQWGVCGHPVSQGAYFRISISTQLDLVKELGAGWYRCDWPEAAFYANPSRLDELVEESTKRGIKLLPVLISSGDLKNPEVTPGEIQATAEKFGHAIATRYKGKITHWELNNELDNYCALRKGETAPDGSIWKWDASNGDDPAHYEESRYLKARAEIKGLYLGIKSADPSAITIVNTAGWLHFGFIQKLLVEDQVPFDVLAWHWYSEMGEITAVQGKIDLLELLQKFGKPLWITEINRRNGSMENQTQGQADYLQPTLDKLANDSRIEAIFVYELLDEPELGDSTGEAFYGLVTLEKSGDNWILGNRKPAFDVFKNLTSPANR